MAFYAILLLSFTTLVYSLPATVGPVSDLTIVNKFISPDGFERSAVLANGMFPGPLISGKKGDKFTVTVRDSLDDPSMELATSIHWHGLLQNGTNYNDGAAWVTQCPIVPGETYTYNFASTNQAGTFWYHSHIGTQYCDGLRGPLVIYDPKDQYRHLYDIDDESTIITLSDWYHAPGGLFPMPDATLINGLGRSFPGSAPNTTSLTPLHVLTVQRGKRYRLRLVSMACHPQWMFSIDSHAFTVIEADGVPTAPLPGIDSLTIFAAQRYSLILHADQPVGNYWIRALPNMGYKGFEGGVNVAVLRYVGAPAEEPASVPAPPLRATLRETDLHALLSDVPTEDVRVPGRPEPGGADVNIHLDLGYSPSTNFTVDRVSFVPPSMPVLLQMLSGASDARKMMPEGSVVALPKNKVVEVSFGGVVAGGPHPFHLHGHTFHVVRSAGSEEYNYVNPVVRDVLSVGGSDGSDNATIRFVTDNPGPWFLHCHIDYHLNAGLGVIFAEDTPNVAEHNQVTQEWKDLCPAYEALRKP